MNKDQWHKRRLRAEKRFRFYGRAALALSALILVVLLTSLFVRGLPGFFQSQIRLDITFDAPASGKLVKQALLARFPEAGEENRRALIALISNDAAIRLKRMEAHDVNLNGTTKTIWFTASSAADLYLRGKDSDKLTDAQRHWLDALTAKGETRRVFNIDFFTEGDSRQPEQAGFLGAMAGSALTLLVCLGVAFPLGVMTAVYLEEFARPGKFVDFLEVNINNLAAVPSIVFGLLGLSIYINVLHLPRSAPLVGGLTLALMILPVIIITTRTSLKSVPGSIRQAALALGATKLQTVWHHTLRLAMPGIMTGTILGVARAIGETAPLLMIGMVAFVADIPGHFTDPATVMPVQVYLWAGSPEAGFAEKTAAGILLLIMLLLALNALAIYLRKRFEVRW